MVVIVDYGLGNLRSVQNCLQRQGHGFIISSNEQDIYNAEKLILPGVGNFARGMENLRSLRLLDVLNEKILHEKTPVLGICLGMQLFSKWSEEGNVDGLGWLDANTVHFNIQQASLKIPHVGWNTIRPAKHSRVIEGLDYRNTFFYFVHSYYMKCNQLGDIVAVTKYGIEFPSIVQKENIYGTQFHPEKSHDHGAVLLDNFVKNV